MNRTQMVAGGKSVPEKMQQLISDQKEIRRSIEEMNYDLEQKE